MNESIEVREKNFIKRAKQRHGNKFGYETVVYKNNYTPVEILCKEHGIFIQAPRSHVNSKFGCPKCKTNKTTQKPIVKKESIIKRVFRYLIKR